MPKKKIKLNDNLEKNNKKGKLKQEKYVSEESQEIRRFVFILLGVIVTILIVYGITLIAKKDSTTTEDNVTEGAINYNIVSVGTMLSKSDDEYYVMVYDTEKPNAAYYATLAGMYSSKNEGLKLYYCDLGNKLNSEFAVKEGESSNPKATGVDDFAFGEITLVRVKNGKVTKYLEDVDTIKTELGL